MRLFLRTTFLSLLFGFFLLSSTAFASYDLRISEISFDGSDERIELVNLGSMIFTGNIDIQGAKSSLLSIPDIHLGAYETIIIGDTLAMISPIDPTRKTSNGLSLSDTKELNLSLLFSGSTLDTAHIPLADIQALNNKKTSFERHVDSSGMNLGWAEATSGTNTISPWLGSPGVFVYSSGLPTLDDSEPTNTGDSGSSGDDGFSTDADIGTGSTIAGTGTMITGGDDTDPPPVGTGSQLDETGGDTGGYDTSGLTDDGEEGETAGGSDGTQQEETSDSGGGGEQGNTISGSTEGTYLGSDTGRQDTNTSTGNSGESMFLQEHAHLCHISVGIVDDFYTVQATNEFHNGYTHTRYVNNILIDVAGISSLSGAQNHEIRLVVSLPVGLIVCESSVFLSAFSEEIVSTSIELLAGGIRIDEVHAYDTDRFGEYIELLAYQDWAGTLIVGGLGSSTGEKSFDVDMRSGERVIVTDSPESFAGLGTVIEVGSITLTNGGETLSMRRADDLLVDTLTYTSGTEGFSQYYNDEDDLYSVTLTSTPGYGFESVAHILDTSDQMNCDITIQNSTDFDLDNSINLIASADDRELSNGLKKYECQWFGETLPDGFDTSVCNPKTKRRKEGGLFDIFLKVHHSDGRVCETGIQLNIPEGIDVPSCKASYYEKLYHKRKDKHKNECNESPKEKKSDSLGALPSFPDLAGEVSLGDLSSPTHLLARPEVTVYTDDLLIMAVLPNPAGRDAGAEGIRLHNTSTRVIDLSEILVYNGKKTISLEGIIDPGEERELTGNRGLYNKASCMRLQDSEGIYDELCYPKPSNGTWYSKNTLTIADLAETQWQGNVKLAIEGDQVCALYADEQLICAGLPYTKEKQQTYKNELSESKKLLKKEVSKVKKLERSVTSLEKKLLKSTDKTTKERNKRAADKKKLTALLSQEKGKTRQAFVEVALHKEVVYETVGRLRENRGAVYEISDIDVLYTQRREIQEEMKEKPSEYRVASVSFAPEDLVLAYKVRSETVTLADMDVVDLYGPLLRDTQQYFKDVGQRLVISDQSVAISD